MADHISVIIIVLMFLLYQGRGLNTVAYEDKEVDQRGHGIVIIYGSDTSLHKQG